MPGQGKEEEEEGRAGSRFTDDFDDNGWLGREGGERKGEDICGINALCT